MVNDFLPIYPDELLYSVLGRYHQIDGNKNIKRMFEDLFSKATVIPVVDLPCHIEKLCSNIPEELGYSSDYIIQNCTLFPFYSPFMSHEARTECISIIKSDNGSGLKTKMGIVAGGICKKGCIYYCPECVRCEIRDLLEPYIHRLHQVEGVFICVEHKCKLKEYTEGSSNRFQFTCLDVNNIDYKTEFIDDSMLSHRLFYITKEVKYLLENDLATILYRSIIHQKYYCLLGKRGYLTPSKKIKQRKLINDFTGYYGNELLYLLDSQIDSADESNWLKIVLRKPNRATHPIRHILLMDFLAGSIENFVKYESSAKITPLCLNKLCSHYKMSDKTMYAITADYKTREPVITVTCNECEFKYSRKESRDICEIGSVKDYGFLWLNRLKNVIKASSNKSLRAISMEMGCDCKTVVKYAEKLNLSHLLRSIMKINIAKKITLPTNNKKGDYRKTIITYTKKHPSALIKDIKRDIYREYMWLYKNDGDWLKQNLPKPNQNVSNINKRVDWGKRDIELLQILRREYMAVISNNNLVRITKTLLGRRCGKLSYIEKKLDKLPLSNEFLEAVQESVEEFQIRRVKAICNELYKKDGRLIEWKIRKLAGLKRDISRRVQEVIDANIKKLNWNFINQFDEFI